MKIIGKIIGALVGMLFSSVAFAQQPSPSGDGSLAANAAGETPQPTVQHWSPQLLKAICDKIDKGGTVTAQAVAEAKAVTNAELEKSKKRVTALEKRRDQAVVEANQAKAKANVRTAATATIAASKPRGATQPPRPQYRRRKVGCNACARVAEIERRLDSAKRDHAATATAVATAESKLPGQFTEELRRANALTERFDDLDKDVKEIRRELDVLTGFVAKVAGRVEVLEHRKLGSYLTFGPLVGMTLLADGDVKYTSALLGARLRFLITEKVSVIAEGGAAVDSTGTGTFGNVLVSYSILKWLAVEAGPGGVWSDLSASFLTRRMFLHGNVGVSFRPWEQAGRGAPVISIRGIAGISRDSVATRAQGGYEAFLSWEF